jgi:hypothetical protein
MSNEATEKTLRIYSDNVYGAFDDDEPTMTVTRNLEGRIEFSFDNLGKDEVVELDEETLAELVDLLLEVS